MPALVALFLFGYISLGEAQNSNPLTPLEGTITHGNIRAEGILGLFQGRATLVFKAGELIWMDGSSRERGPYQARSEGHLIHFTAQTPLEYDGGSVMWRGTFDGNTLLNVRADWRRKKGSFWHDLLLPEIVTWHFTPDTGTESPEKETKGGVQEAN